MKRRFAVDLLRRREHDFVFYNFAELHKAGHFFWKFHDRSHPDFSSEEPQLQNALREVYADMDRAIGSVLEQLGTNDDLVLVTDRGMYADYRGDHLIEKVLLKLELAVPRGESPLPGELRPLMVEYFKNAYVKAQQLYQTQLTAYDAPNRPQWMHKPEPPGKVTDANLDDFIRRVLPDLATDRRRVHLSGDVEVFDPDQPWVWFIPSVLADEIWPTTPAATAFGGLMPGIAYYQLRTRGAPPRGVAGARRPR